MIEDVHREAWRRTRLARIVFFVATVFFAAWNIWSGAYGVLQLCIVPLGLYAVIYYVVRLKLQRQFMMQFASANSLSFREKGDVAEFRGALFSLGHSRTVRNVAEGTYTEHPFRLFNYSFSEGSGKSQRMFQCTVAEIVTGSAMPSIFLESAGFALRLARSLPKRGSGESLRFASHPKKVVLEGRWEKRFDLYVPEDYEMEALQIFTPEVLGVLESCFSTGFRFALELTGDRCYVYVPGTVGKARVLRSIYDMLGIFLTRVGPELRRMQRGLEAQREIYTRPEASR